MPTIIILRRLILEGYLISQNCYEALWIPKKEKGS